MANATTLNIGQVNGSGATDQMFLNIFSGEVLTAFKTATVTSDKHFVRTITEGKSAKFPATWKVNAGYHTPGNEIVGQASNVAERIINIDDLLLASVFIPVIDEAKNHFDYRGIYSNECGIALANTWDKNVLQVGLLAARASATVTGAYGGTSLTSSGTLYKTSASDLVAGITAAAQAMDEKDVPAGQKRYTFLRPAQYYLLASTPSTLLLNRDYVGGNGDLSEVTLTKVAGTTLVKTNNLPNSNVATGPTQYQGDFSKTAFLCMTDQAVGTLKLLDLSSEMEYDIRRQGTLVLSKYAMGTGILRPECSVEGKTTTYELLPVSKTPC